MRALSSSGWHVALALAVLASAVPAGGHYASAVVDHVLKESSQKFSWSPRNPTAYHPRDKMTFYVVNTYKEPYSLSRYSYIEHKGLMTALPENIQKGAVDILGAYSMESALLILIGEEKDPESLLSAFNIHVLFYDYDTLEKLHHSSIFADELVLSTNNMCDVFQPNYDARLDDKMGYVLREKKGADIIHARYSPTIFQYGNDVLFTRWIEPTEDTRGGQYAHLVYDCGLDGIRRHGCHKSVDLGPTAESLDVQHPPIQLRTGEYTLVVKNHAGRPPRAIKVDYMKETIVADAHVERTHPYTDLKCVFTPYAEEQGVVAVFLFEDEAVTFNMVTWEVQGHIADSNLILHYSKEHGGIMRGGHLWMLTMANLGSSLGPAAVYIDLNTLRFSSSVGVASIFDIDRLVMFGIDGSALKNPRGDNHGMCPMLAGGDLAPWSYTYDGIVMARYGDSIASYDLGMDSVSEARPCSLTRMFRRHYIVCNGPEDCSCDGDKDFVWCMVPNSSDDKDKRDLLVYRIARSFERGYAVHLNLEISATNLQPLFYPFRMNNYIVAMSWTNLLMILGSHESNQLALPHSSVPKSVTIGYGGHGFVHVISMDGELVSAHCRLGTGGESCRSCEPGFAKETSGPSQCSPCPSGTSSSLVDPSYTGSRMCYACRLGYYSGPQWGACDPCPPGTTSTRPGNIEVCNLCTKNPCKYLGKCTASAGQIQCDCRWLFIGDRCQYPIFVLYLAVIIVVNGIGVSGLVLLYKRLKRYHKFVTFTDSQLKTFMQPSRQSWEVDLTALEPVNIIKTSPSAKLQLARWNGTTVVVKIYLNATEDTSGLANREHQIFSKCRHPNILGYYGSALDPNCVVLEYAPEGSLHDYIHSKQKLDTKTILRFARHICYALKYLHSLDVVHRDLKPSNVLLFSNRTVAKVCDFDCSRNIALDMTAYVGSPAYMAPEVASKYKSHQPPHDSHQSSVELEEVSSKKILITKSKRRYSLLRSESVDVESTQMSTSAKATDTYSYGILLLEMFTRTKPQGAVDIQSGQTRSIHIPMSIPKEWRALITSCLSLSPDARPTFDEIAHTLESSIPGAQLAQAIQHD